MPDLFICAKHLFVEAMVAIVPAQAGQMMSNGTSSVLNSEQDLATIPMAQGGLPPGYRAPQKRWRAGGALPTGSFSGLPKGPTVPGLALEP